MDVTKTAVAGIAAAILLGSVASPAGARAKYPTFDVHVHLSSHPSTSLKDRLTVNRDDAADIAVPHMDVSGVRISVIMPTPTVNGRLGYQTLVAQAKRYPGRFVVRGGRRPAQSDDSAYAAGSGDAQARTRIQGKGGKHTARGAIGFGEMAGLQFSFVRQHPFEHAPPDHPLFLLLADIAAEHDVPVDIHHELVVREIDVPKKLRSRSEQNPSRVGENVAGFERTGEGEALKLSNPLVSYEAKLLKGRQLPE
jgi:hypothetical protein